jgi:hypothetical protein
MTSKIAQADVTPVRQRTQYSCMATSMAMCLNALDHKVTEDEVNAVMGATPLKGAAWEQALACAQHYGCRATLTTPSTVTQLKQWTDAGVPVMIAWNPEGREWSHASVVFHVDDDLNVHVADPNIPDPEETVRVVPKGEFYKKWYEKWPRYLVRRPACAIDREITPEGRQVMASERAAARITDHADGVFFGHWSGYVVTLEDGSELATDTGNRAMSPGSPVKVIIQDGSFSVFYSRDKTASKNKRPQPTTRTEQEKREDKNKIRGKAPKRRMGPEYVDQVQRRPGAGRHQNRERDVDTGRSRKPKHPRDWQRSAAENVVERLVQGSSAKTAEPSDCYKDGLRGRALADCYKSFPDDLSSDDIAFIRRYYPGWSPYERRYYDQAAASYYQWGEIAELMGQASNAKFIKSVASYVMSKGAPSPKQQAVLDRIRKRYVSELRDPEKTLETLQAEKRLKDEEEARLKEDARQQNLTMLESVSGLATFNERKWFGVPSGYDFVSKSEFSEGPYEATVIVDYGRMHLFTGAVTIVKKDGQEIFKGKVLKPGGKGYVNSTSDEIYKFSNKAKAFAQGLIAADIQGKPLASVTQPKAPSAPAKAPEPAAEATGERHTWDDLRTQRMIEILDVLINKTGMGMFKGFKRDLETGKGLTENQLKAVRHQLYKNRMRPDTESFKLASMSLEEVVAERFAASVTERDLRASEAASLGGVPEFDWKSFGAALRVALDRTPVPPKKVTGTVYGGRVSIELQFGRDYYEKKGWDDDKVGDTIDKVARKHGLKKVKWNIYQAPSGLDIEVGVMADSYGGSSTRLAGGTDAPFGQEDASQLQRRSRQ